MSHPSWASWLSSTVASIYDHIGSHHESSARKEDDRSYPASVDFAKHFSLEARLMRPNPIKSIWKMVGQRSSTINLGTGDPHPNLYPLSKVEFMVASTDGPNPVTNWLSDPPQYSQAMVISGEDRDGIPGLASAFKYGAGGGLPAARQSIRYLMEHIHHPPAEYDVSLTLGNGDGLTKAFRLLGDRGETFLAEEFTFTAMTNAAYPLGINWHAVPIDEKGIIPKELEGILADWDFDSMGKRPHVLYTIPCSQNPTGSTVPLERREEIYRIASRFDLLIIEDDPYYFLQYDLPKTTDGDILRKLPKSYLSMDIEGRVLRFDSLSKIIAPGLRIGWVTANPAFCEKFNDLTDSSSQQPHGLGQAFLVNLLNDTSSNNWGIRGLGRWISGLSIEYQRKRDLFMALFDEHVGRHGWATASTPKSGMFVWIRINLEKHPQYYANRRWRQIPSTNTTELMDRLFLKNFESGLILMPASVFIVNDSSGRLSDHSNFFRGTFSVDDETITRGLEILGSSLQQFFAA